MAAEVDGRARPMERSGSGVSDWVNDYFADVDSMDIDAFLSHLSDDVVVNWANADPFVGKQAVAEAIGGFYQAIDAMQHELVNVYDEGNEKIVEADVHYTRKDGRRVRVRAMTVLRRRDDVVDQVRVFLDTAPVFEA
jgi:ketosteroid isomerase-like protein